MVALAQVTITQNDMPHAGDELFRTRAVPNPLLNYTNTGAGITWNFTNLIALDQDARSYQSVASTNVVYALVYADIFFNGNRANHATEGVDIPFYEQLPIENPYTFYFRSNSVYRKVGYGAEVAGIPVPITMDQQDVIYQLPLNFGNTSTSTSAYDIAVPTLAYYGYRQVRNNVVDGWGVVNTPAGSFNALRVKTTLAGRDTIQVDQFSLGFAIERPLITEYKWLSPGRRVPVLQINTATILGAEVITEVFFYDVERTINVVQPLANNFCPGQQVQVNYTRNGVFNAGGILIQGNVFRAQLSDANGSFANPVNIGSVTSTQSGVINATIPANTPPGNGYRVRVISTNPAFTGADNGFNITIGTPPLAAVSAAGPPTFCEGGSVVLNASTNPAFSYQWQLAGAAIAGATGASLEASSSGSYRVVVTTACGTATSTPVNVLVNPLPEHALVPPQGLFTCAGEAVTFGSTDLVGQAGLDYQWLLNGVAIPGADAATYTTAVAGAYALQTTNPSTGCSFTTTAEDLVVEEVPAPFVVANGPTTFCNGGSVQLEATGVDGALYQWFLQGNGQGSAGAGILTAAEAGVYTATAQSAAGCVSLPSNEVLVTVDALPAIPEVVAQGATTFCEGGEVELEAVGDAGVSWAWAVDGDLITGAVGANLLVSNSGTYTVVATNAAGCEAATPNGVTVVVDALPAAPVLQTAGPTTVCEGASVELTAIAEDGVSFSWELDGAALPGAGSNTFTATVTGSYRVSVTNAAGCIASAAEAVTVTVDPVPSTPVVNATGSTTFCAGASVVLEVAADPGVDLQWTVGGQSIPGADGPLLQVSTSGQYGVVATNQFGCSSLAQQSVDVVVNPLPAVPNLLAADLSTFCAGSSVTLVAVGQPGIAFAWYRDGQPINGASTGQFLASEAGSYTVAAVSQEGCLSAFSNAITVEVLPLPAAPVAVAEGPTSFCAGSSVALNVSGEPGSAFSWTLNGVPIQGAGGAGYLANATGTYAAVAINGFGCVSQPSNSIVVNVVPLPAVPTITALDPVSFCAGGSAVLVATSEPGVSYQWSLNGATISGANAAQYQAVASGAYSATAIGPSGCVSAASWPTVITVWPLPSEPVLTASGPTSFCSGGSVLLTTTVDPGLAIQWSVDGNAIDGATGGELLVTTSGAYAVTVEDGNGCNATSGIAMVFANPNPEPVSLVALGTAEICAGGSVVLSAGIAPGISYLWYLNDEPIAGATTPTYVATEAGVYTVVAVSADGCAAAASEAVEVTVDPLPAPPQITLTESPVFCQGASTTLVAVADAGLTYQWTAGGQPIPGATGPQWTVSEQGDYGLVVTNAAGCSSAAVNNVQVTVNDLPPTPVIGQEFDVLVASGTGSFQWSFNGSPIPGATQQDLTATANGVYTVTVTNSQGCSSTSQPFTVSNVGVEERGSTHLRIYPNPSAGQFILDGMMGSTEPVVIEVYDATGRLVHTTLTMDALHIVDLSEATSGSYVLHVVQGVQRSMHRVVIAR